MNKTCSGCGVSLQCDNELNPGYIPSNKIDNANYCKRCFRLIHYGDISNKDMEKSTKLILDKVNSDNIFKVFIIDLLNINNNTINIFNKIKGNKLLLISKYDLIDESINFSHIIDNIKEVYNINNDIKFISVKDEYGISSLINYLSSKNVNKCYFLGPSNSGKSTLINKLLDIYNINKDRLTISNKRNTTLEFINIKLDKDLSIIDSPGFLMSDYNLNSKYKNIIKPITFNMKDNECIKIDNFYIKFNNNTSITIYCYDKIDIKKYYKDINFDINMSINSSSDLCVNGFGFIRIKNSNDISISGLDSNLISVRDSII